MAKEKAEKDPIIAGLLSFLLPGLGYLYIDSEKYMKKALIYILGTIIAWVFSIVLILLYLLGFILSPVFSTIYFPIMFFLYDLIVVYDTYLYAKTGAGILP